MSRLGRLAADPFAWLITILLVSFALGGISEAIDWLDRRSCRVDGGVVQPVGDSHEWRCVHAEVRP